MTAFGVGASDSCATDAVTQNADNSVTDVPRTKRFVTTPIKPLLAPHVGDRAGHLVSGLNDLGVHLVGALRRDQVGDLGHWIDVGRFDVALLQNAEGRVARDACGRLSGSLGLLEVVAAKRLETRV